MLAMSPSYFQRSVPKWWRGKEKGEGKGPYRGAPPEGPPGELREGCRGEQGQGR